MTLYGAVWVSNISPYLIAEDVTHSKIVAKAAGALAATTLGTMYLNARHLIGNDFFPALSLVTNAPMKFMAQRQAEGRVTVTDDLQRHAMDPKTKENLFLIFEGRTWTYAQFWSQVLKVAKWLVDELKVEAHEIVALNGGNSPEYLVIWFALEAIGAVPAFINCNLTKEPLLHCIRLCNARVCLVDKDIKSLVEPVESSLAEGTNEAKSCQVIYFDQWFIESLPEVTDTAFSDDRRKDLRIDNVSSLIYTSGTTGMPKGTILWRGREINTARGVALYLGLQPGSRMYTCLPLYHGAAHGLCITPSIYGASTVVLSRKFSHKTFWAEVRESKADVLQYVGELCRYLINAPPHPLDKQHNVKMAWGNGMRPDVWGIFRERFAIESINELYAATDGLGGSFNNNKGDFGRNAIGRRGLLWNWLNGKNEKRVKIDVVSQEILRDSNGFAITCKDGEAGEVVHRIDPAREKMLFAGYYGNEAAGEKRKIRDLFEKGDYWFRSGDMMRQDPDGCVYFVDRLGDTFRWKSENVSTSEVGDVVGEFDQVAEANVYGVQVPFADGRCGCVAVVMVEGLTEDKFDFDALANRCLSTLPRYAVPVFVRIVKELQYTGTMKVQKGQLREEGIDLDKISDGPSQDAMYWLPPGTSKYVPFRRKDLEELKGGRVRL